MNRAVLPKPKARSLVIINLLLMGLVIICSIVSADIFRSQQIDSRQTDFNLTIESMKSVTQNYLESERGYVDNWSDYITTHNMTREEALSFLRSINTNKERYAHIVDMDGFKAWSANEPAGKEAIDNYVRYYGNVPESERYMNESLLEVFSDKDTSRTIIGNYTLDEAHESAVALGHRITLKTKSGKKDYLLLRVIPTNALKKSWVFPAEYQSAEVGIITTNGDYIIKSTSMKSRSFLEYMRVYAFDGDFAAASKMGEELATAQNGQLTFCDFRGSSRIWRYTALGDDSNLIILSSIQESELEPPGGTRHIIFLVCGTLLILAVIDGLHLVRTNRKLQKAAEEAREASLAKTRFLSAMSHDIRTPMNAVLGMISIAKDNISNPSYASECLDKAGRAGNQLLTLINDVLDISRIESGRFSITLDTVSIPTLMADLTETLSHQAEERDIDLSIDIDHLPNPCVTADPVRLTQVFNNLAANAIKYTEPGGTVRIELNEEPTPGNEAKTRLVFKVTDSGIGMSEEFQKNMYHAFTRAVDTQVNKTQGSGLGLSIVAQIVKQAGGTIDCQSELGKGSCFTVAFDLDIAEPTGNDEKLLPESADHRFDLNILAAEDNDLNWEIIQVMLESHGATCKHAVNGKECVEIFEASSPGTFDAIFMDLQMPIMDGLSATKAIRELPDERGAHIPIIAMTADAFAEDVQACLEGGMDGHMPKPIDAKKLGEYLTKIEQGQL